MFKKGSPIKAEDINTVKRYADLARNIKGGAGINVSSGETGMALSFAPPLKSNKPVVSCTAVNESTSPIKPLHPVVITGQFRNVNSNSIDSDIILIVRPPEAGDEVNAIVAVALTNFKGQYSAGAVAILGACMSWASGNANSDSETVVGINQSISGENFYFSSRGSVNVLWRDTSIDFQTNTPQRVLILVGGSGGGPPLTSTAPQPVGTLNSVGNGTKAAREDHVHSSDFRVISGQGQYRNSSTGEWVGFTHFI